MPGRNPFALALVAALALRAAIALFLQPASDVYYYLSEAVRTILSGMNPYEHLYTTVPPDLATAGASHVLAYLPGAFLFLIPFALGDIRWGAVLVDLVIGACLYAYGGGRRRSAALIFLFAPPTILFSTLYLDASLVGVGFVALYFVLESRGLGWLAAVCLGIALASTQFTVLVLPPALAYYAARRRAAEPVLVLASAALVVAPFFLVSPSDFLSQTVSFQFSRAVYPLVSYGGAFGFSINPSLSGLTSWAFGVPAPVFLKAIIELAALIPLVRARDLTLLARNSALFVLLSAFVLPNDFFWAYLELPLVLGLFWFSRFGSAASTEILDSEDLKLKRENKQNHGADGRASKV